MDNFYIYVILDPRKSGKYIYDNIIFDFEPFYIGKGTGYRYAISSKEINKNNKKSNKLKAISKSNNIPIVIKLKENLLEFDAFKLETYYINLIGRSDLKKGPLTNHTDGGEGSSGRINISQLISVDQYDLNGKFIKNYTSITEASKETNIKEQNIGAVINGRYKSVGGYLWCKKGKKLNIPREEKLNKRTILQYDLNGNFIKEWKTTTEAKNMTGANNITYCCQGKIRNSGGYVWRYKNIEQINKGYLNYNIKELNHNGNFNKTKHKPETLEKMKKNLAKSVIQYDLNNNNNNNNKTAEFISISEASRITGINKSSIHLCCNNKRNSAGGYKWKYL